MSSIKTKVHAGRIELDVPNDWPNGLEVEVRPLTGPADNEDLMTPEEIAITLESMRRFEQVESDDESHQKTEEVINARKQREKAEFQKYLEKLKQGWN